MKKKLLIALGIAALLPLSSHAQKVMVVYGHSGQHLLEDSVESISSLMPSDDVLNVKSRLGQIHSGHNSHRKVVVGRWKAVVRKQW